MDLQIFNNLDTAIQREELFKCCGCTAWVERLLKQFPFQTLEALKRESDRIWYALEEKNWKEAFTHHPKIGDVESLRKKFASTAGWASNEQSGVNEATDAVLKELKDGNDAYEKKFGYIFIVCATGKTANEMSALLRVRLNNSPEEELKVAMEEQNKITHLRLEKLFS